MRGRVLTRTFSFETRQHSLFGVDLGEGFPRRALGLGALLLGTWFGLLTLLFGLPNPQTSLFDGSFPILIIFFGLQPSPKVHRRRRMTDWLLHARFLTRSHEGIVNGHPARMRHDRLKLRERFSLDWFHTMFGSRSKDWDPWAANATSSRPFTAQGSVHTGQSLRLAGFDAMNDLRRKEKTHG